MSLWMGVLRQPEYVLESDTVTRMLHNVCTARIALVHLGQHNEPATGFALSQRSGK